MLKFFTVLLCLFLLAGCRSGGGSGFESSGSGSTYGGSQEFDIVESTTPEPSTLILLGIGLAGLAAKMLIKKRTR